MELKEFISQSITQIVQGIIEGHNQVYKVGAIVNPRMTNLDLGNVQRNDISPARGDIGKHTNFLEFDIAVTASEDEKGKGGLGIFAGSIGIGATGETGSANSQQSRLRFTIPIQFPDEHLAPHKQPED